MPLDPDRNANSEWLSEEEAHRILARAVELDSRDMSDVSLSQLREVAKEAGIGSNALEHALNELRQGASPRVSSIGAHTTVDRRQASHPLSFHLSRFRTYAAFFILVTVATITPGDTVVPLLSYSVPLCALYELLIIVVRAKEGRGGKPRVAALASGRSAENVSTATQPAPNQVKRSLLLRPV